MGIDLSERQLHHARAACAAVDSPVSLVQCSAEQTPFADASFDLVFCDHGATSFARPEFTVSEAARLLRSGGRFAFNMASPLHDVAWDYERDVVGDRLANDYFEMCRLKDGKTISYQLTYGDWIRLFRKHQLRVEDLIEIRPPEDAQTTYGTFVPLEWARRWPAENIWVLVKE